MTMVIRIDLNNAAFFPDPCTEVARILREAADDIEKGKKEPVIMDSNGNRVGRVTYCLKYGKTCPVHGKT